MNKIREKLFEMQDKQYQKFHSTLCPNVNDIIGVRVPNLRKLAKQIAKENPKEFLQNTPIQFYEEKMLYGFVIGYQKVTIEETIKYLDKFVPMIDNWAVCDCCVSTFKFIEKNRELFWKYIQKYINSNQEYELRFAIIMLMDYYLTEEYVDKVLEIYNQISYNKNNISKNQNTNKELDEGYYVKMAVAWAISVCYVKFPKKIMQFLKHNQLDDFTYNKALQKMIESYRVEKNIKNDLRKMKRK